MTGTLINVAAIIIGGALGCLMGGRLPEGLRKTVVAGLGLFVLALGAQTFLVTHNSLVPLGGLLIGALLGEWWQVEEGIRNLGRWLERVLIGRLTRSRAGDPKDQAASEAQTNQQERFVRGFFTASLVFVVGPVAIMGALNDGISGNYQLLAVKAILDGFASLAFASSLGVGVLFSALPILIYQGGITLAAVQLKPIMTPLMMDEMSAVGGLILISIAISSLLEIKPIRTGNFLPALIVTPLIVWALTILGIHWIL